MAKKQQPAPEETIEEEPAEAPAEEAKPDPKLGKFAEAWFAAHADEGVADIGFEPAHCDCGASACKGYQMVNPADRSNHYH